MRKKKLIIILLSVFLAVAVGVSAFFIFPIKKDSVVNPVVAETQYLSGQKLENIELKLKDGDTKGEISWVDPNYVLILGNNECEWKFVPENKRRFKEQTGKIKIVAKSDSSVTAEIQAGTYYAENKLSTVTISVAEGGTAGTIAWADPNTLLVAGENEYNWVFTPTDTTNYISKTGKIKVVAQAQAVIQVAYESGGVATGYKAFETYNTNDLLLKVTYDGGKVETISNGYTISYNSGSSLLAGDTKVVATYAGKNCDIEIDEVSKIAIEKPTVVGAYTYDASEQTAVLSETENDDLFTVSGKSQTNAAKHTITLTLKDDANYVWAGSDSATATLDFVIEKADQVVVKNEYTGTYDKTPHKATVSSVNGVAIYYSLTELNAENYKSSYQSVIERTNAGTTTIYYYIVGDSNHKDASGSILINIAKALPTVETSRAYAVISEKAANMPKSYVTVKGIGGETVTGEIGFKYYKSYTDEQTNVPTDAVSGAESTGAAPKTAGEYVVVTTFEGNDNYLAATCLSALVIDDPVLIASLNENPFAWQTAFRNQTASFGENYVEFYKNDTGDFVSLDFKMRNGESTFKNGRVVCEDGIYFLIYNGTNEKHYIEIESDESAIYVYNESNVLQFSMEKWQIPLIDGEFECDTTPDVEAPNSKITIVNNHGKITFTFERYVVSGDSYAQSDTILGVVKVYQTYLSFVWEKTDGNIMQLFTLQDFDFSSVCESFEVSGTLVNASKVNGEYVKI